MADFDKMKRKAKDKVDEWSEKGDSDKHASDHQETDKHTKETGEQLRNRRNRDNRLP